MNINIGADMKKKLVNSEATILRNSSLNGEIYARRIPKMNVRGRRDS